MTPSTAARIPNTTVSFTSMLKQAVVDANDESFGRLEDAIIKLRNDQYPLLIGLVVDAGDNRVFVPASDVIKLDADRIRLRIARKDLLQIGRAHV